MKTSGSSGLLGVVSMACVVKIKSPEFVTKRLSEKFGKLWIAAEVILFVLVGAAVDIRYTLDAGLAAVGLIFLSLIFRSVGVLLCVAATKLSWKERLFCVIAYLPKATVQAAMGSVPLAMGLACGSDGPFGSGSCNPDYRTTGSNRNRRQLQTAAGNREEVLKVSNKI